MRRELFLIIYIALNAIMIITEVCVLRKDKGRFLRYSCKGMRSILLELENSEDERMLAKEIENLYNRYVQEFAGMKRFFPNVIIWIDAVIFRIDLEYGYARQLDPYCTFIKGARDILESHYPYSKCEKYQQSILNDMKKLREDKNEILIDNIISRTEEEFLRLSGDIKKKQVGNIVSIMLGAIGIIVSVLMAFVRI